MLTDKFQLVYQAIHSAMMDVGNSAPRIVDRIIDEVFPDTADAAEREGADKMLRDGVIIFVTKYLKRSANLPMEGQGDFADISAEFRDIVKKLSKPSHYVPSLQQHMPVSFLIANPDALDEARQFKREKGMETLAEADALDELYEAVTSRLI